MVDQLDAKSYKKLAHLCNAAANSLNVKYVEKILEKEGDIKYQIPASDFIKSRKPDLIGSTALHLIVRDVKYFKTVLNNGADYTLKNAKGLTVLHEAAKSYCTFYRDRYGLDYPYEKCNSDDLESILSAYVEAGIFAHPCDQNGISHLHLACMTNHTQAIEFFQNNGIPIDQPVNIDSPIFAGYRPLHFAAKCGEKQATDILLKNHADLSLKNGRQMTALHVAIDRYMEMIDWMHVNRLKAIYFSFYQSEIDNLNEVLKVILSVRDPEGTDLVDDQGLSFFHASCTLKDSSLAQRYLDNNVDVNRHVNMNSPVWPGYTPLHFAAHFNADTAKLLVSRGANIIAKNAHGETPLDICAGRFKVEDIYFILSSHDLLKDIVLSDGKTKLLDVVGAMQNANQLTSFLDDQNVDVNSFVPRDSPIWQGYSVLHLTVLFTETIVFFTDTRSEINGDSSDTSSEASADNSDDDSDDAQNDDSVDNNSENSSEAPSEEQSELSLHINDRGCRRLESVYNEKLKVCLDRGADINATDVDGVTPLHLAFRLRMTNFIEVMLKYHSKDVNSIDKDNLSHLHVACYAKNETVVKKLLTNGADVNTPLLPSFKWYVNEHSPIYTARSSELKSAGCTPLHFAVRTRNKKITKLLLEHGADVNAEDCNGFTPLHRSLYLDHDNSSIVKVLLSSPDLKQTIFDGRLSTLHIASYSNHVDAVRRLLDMGADVNLILMPETDCTYDDDYLPEPLSFVKKFTGYTPLQVAIANGSNDVVRLLLQQGADIFIRNSVGRSSFHDSLMHEENLVLSAIESDVSLQKRMTEDSGITMLHLACHKHDHQAVERLLSQGADVNAQAHPDAPVWPGWTPMHALVVKSSKSYCEDDNMRATLRLMLEHGSDLTLTNDIHETPLHFTVTNCFSSSIFRNYCLSYKNPLYSSLLLKGLLDFGVNSTSIDGLSHLHVACITNDVDIARKLLENGAEVNQPIDFFCDRYPGCTPLHLAVTPRSSIDNSSRLAMVDLLLEYGAELNAEDSYGNTPIHFAVRCKSPREPLLKRMVSAGANIHAQTIYGQTPMEIFLKTDDVTRTELEFFFSHGYQINSFNPLSNEGYLSQMLFAEQAESRQAVMKPLLNNIIACDSLNVDNDGRTILHNFVSTGFLKLESGDYAHVMRELVERGHDVDRQDKLGRTALHAAAEFANPGAVEDLLWIGADVNVTDTNGKTALEVCIENPLGVECCGYDEYGIRAGKILATYIRKMQIFGLYVNEVNSRILLNLSSRYSVDEYEIEKFEKMERMTDLEIGSLSIGFDDFFSETGIVAAYPTMRYAERNAIDAFFAPDNEETLSGKFGDLKGRFKSQYRKIQRRQSMIEAGLAAFKSWIGISFPEICCLAVFRFLTNLELENLIASVD